jgi:hypothetical protein
VDAQVDAVERDRSGIDLADPAQLDERFQG